MPDQIIDRRTVSTPGPRGDVTPEALQAKADAEAAAASASASETAAAASASDAEAAEVSAEAWARESQIAASRTTTVTDWNDATTAGFFRSSNNAANIPPSSRLIFVGIVNVGIYAGKDVIFQRAWPSDPDYSETWFRYRSSGGDWKPWVREGNDTGWENISSLLRPGFDGTVYARAKNDTIEISGSANGSFPAQVSRTYLIDSLPTRFRPTTRQRYGVAYASGLIGSVVAEVGGGLAIANRTVDWNGTGFTLTFLK